jgi:hypothetical protein
VARRVRCLDDLDDEVGHSHLDLELEKVCDRMKLEVPGSRGELGSADCTQETWADLHKLVG